MANIAAWLLALAWPVVKKALVALGIGFATYEGLSIIGGQIQSAVLASWGDVSGVVLQILSLGGMNTAIGIILGATTARLSLVAVGKIAKIN